jgi:hypothetical protein
VVLIGGSRVDVFSLSLASSWLYGLRALFGREEIRSGHYPISAHRACRTSVLACDRHLSFSTLACVWRGDSRDPANNRWYLLHSLATENYSPLLPVGWSLNFEMLFYLMFAATIRFRQTIALASVTTAICILRMISFPFFENRCENGFAAYVFNATILDFVWGIACSYLYVGGYQPPRVVAARLVWASSLSV